MTFMLGSRFPPPPIDLDTNPDHTHRKRRGKRGEICTDEIIIEQVTGSVQAGQMETRRKINQGTKQLRLENVWEQCSPHAVEEQG